MEKDLEKIISSPNRMRESYVKKHYPEIYSKIMDFNDYGISFKERMWYYINDIRVPFGCKCCGNPTTFNKNFKEGYKDYCSAKCAQSSEVTKEKRKQTNLDKYGVTNVAKNEDIKKKIEATNIERYGHKSSFSNEEVRETWRKNIKEKYGVGHVFQLESVKESIKNTMIERYGEHYTKTDEYIEKTIDTNLDKFGEEWYTQTEKYSNETRKTNLEKFGNEVFFNSDYYKEKLEDYLRNKNVEHLSQVKETRDKISETKKKKLKELYDKLYDIIIIKSDNSYVKYSSTCGHVSEISISGFYKRREANEILCTTCNPFNICKPKIEIAEYLDSLNIAYTHNKYLYPKNQLDFYLPDYNIGIEHNGLYWHSEIHKEKGYHQSKTSFFKKKGIDIIHIWEDDWLYKKDIIKSILENRLDINTKSIYARKTIFKKIEDREIVKQFLEENHLQGYSNYSDCFGLLYKGDIVSIMTFGYRPLSDKTELIRYSVKKNHSIVGGSDKLFKNSIKVLDINELISYQDSAIFNGSLYDRLGFIKSDKNYLPYWWVVKGKRENRQKYTKQKLIKEGADPNLTEREIMYSRGYYKIWGCEQIRWEYEL